MTDLGIHLIVLELTTRCNLRCIHCYNDVLENCEDINNDNLKIVVEELERVKPHYLILSGGEPLLLGERFFEIAKKMKRTCQKLYLTTNGQLIRKFPAYLFKIFDNVQISLDGPKEIHEKIRGVGTFEEAIEASKYLKNAGVSVSFLMTLHSLNKDYLEETYRIAKGLGVQFGAERMSPVGRGKSVKPLSPSDWKKLLKVAVEENIALNDPLRFIFKDKLKRMLNPHRITGGCTAGIASLVITPSLDVLPCVRLRIPVGNLKDQSIESIWLNSDVLNKLRNRSGFKGKCGICYYRNICGGCRADAYAETGDYLESDPLCWIEESEVIEDVSNL